MSPNYCDISRPRIWIFFRDVLFYREVKPLFLVVRESMGPLPYVAALDLMLDYPEAGHEVGNRHKVEG